jgi:mannose-1-phosphate guanylyltransferase/mannose-6-phosphate isomerase
MPKQFVSLTEAASPFQQVLKRIADPDCFSPPIIVTNAEFRFIVAEQVQAAGIRASIVLEPVGLDSCPAIAAACAFALTRETDPLLLVVAADHLIPDTALFQQACEEGLALAAQGRIVTFGVKPKAPVTSYGYISKGAAIAGHAAFEIGRFIEKPDRAAAERYVEEGCLWNSGNFLFRAQIMLQELEAYAPATKAEVTRAVDLRKDDLDFVRLDTEAFETATKQSIDYAVMEKTTLAAVLPVEYRWSDIGSWSAVWQVSAKDAAGNVLLGPVEAVSTRDSLVRADDAILTAVLGLSNVIVVATPDAVLVADKDHAEQVKELVASLKAKKRRQATEHVRTYRPWGYYQSADIGARYQVKRICVKPGGRLSLQQHMHRSEHWVVVRGTAEVQVGEDIRVIHENESTYIPIGTTHRLSNPGKIDLELIEVQVGSYLGEDDIVRLEDVYQRRSD